MEYTLAKFFHILFAIIAVGYNASYGVWLARAARQPAETQLFTLRTIKFMDDRIANPLYGLLALSGLFMVFTAGYPLTTFWIAAAIVLYVIVVIIAFTLITPNFRRSLRALEADGPGSAGYTGAMARGRSLGIVVSIMVVAIVFLMVTKPTL
ncbi:MAG TPA: DUF2269 family protein [Candidatus Limnocylindrales bacterium]|nr:DUF2269 family protein [Candidatus Limnocylindrales bacterium]